MVGSTITLNYDTLKLFRGYLCERSLFFSKDFGLCKSKILWKKNRSRKRNKKKLKQRLWNFLYKTGVGSYALEGEAPSVPRKAPL